MDVLQSLNPQQRDAVTHGDGPLLVLAGAGSGKTKVLTHRIAHLISRGVGPANILAVTFTNKAAGEMKERVEALVGFSAQKIWVSTFHSTCVRILRSDGDKNGIDSHFVIYDSSDQLALIKEILKELNINDKNFAPRAVLEAISKAKNELRTPQEYSSQATDFWEKTVERVYQRYQEKLTANKALDFDDLIMQTVLLFRQQPVVLSYYQERFRYLLVDEYQDTNKAQYELVKLLAAKYRNLCVVGDDNQSIYGWRGADIGNILAFERDYPEAKVIKLEQNYRSTQTILDAANNLIQYNIARTNKNLWTQKGQGELIKVFKAMDERDEAKFIIDEIAKLQDKGYKNSDVAILYRTNAQSRPFEEAFLYAGIPYTVVGSLRFYDRKEIKDLIAYLRVVYNPADNVSLNRIINVPKRGIGDGTMAKIQALAAQEGKSIFDTLVAISQGELEFDGRAKKNLADFVKLIQGIRQGQEEGAPLTPLVEEILELSGYRAELQLEKDEHAKGRLENISEFLSATQQYDREMPGEGVGLFLEQLALLSDIDTYDEETDVVTLMTLHSAKGLEFPVVFLAGLEEGIFPHSRSIWEVDQLEEERRLCYVGLTRARERLYLTSAGRRTIFGVTDNRLPSRFLEEVPKELKEEVSSARSLQNATTGHTLTDSVRMGAPRMEQTANTGGSAYAPGQKVAHNKFGTGTVVKVDGEGPDAVVVVAFPGEGVKKLLAGFAPLKIMSK